MNRNYSTILLLYFVFSMEAVCQTPSPSSANKPAASASVLESPAPDAATLTKLLKDFLEGASHNDLAMHERFWAEDVIYTSAAGRRRTKDDIRNDVAKANSSQPKNDQATYSAEDIRIHQSGTSAIVAFELIAITTKEGKTETAHYLNTGTFLKRNGKWQVVAWQATKKGTDEEPKH
jgi:hypothetical protein